MARSTRARLDELLVDRGLADSRDQAERLIRAGLVLVDDCPADKPGSLVPRQAGLRLRGEPCPFVSRGGLKLQAAVEGFALTVSGLRCLDVGIGTGGFTDCLLKAGAAHVTGVDVAYGQVDWSLRSDPRVRLLERTNFRTMDRDRLGEPFDLVTADCSFTSLEPLMDGIAAALRGGGRLVALVKPQFELPAEQVEPGGVVRDEVARRRALERIVSAAAPRSRREPGPIESPTPGARAGNIEWLLLLEKSAGPDPSAAQSSSGATQ